MFSASRDLVLALVCIRVFVLDARARSQVSPWRPYLMPVSGSGWLLRLARCAATTADVQNAWPQSKQ